MSVWGTGACKCTVVRAFLGSMTRSRGRWTKTPVTRFQLPPALAASLLALFILPVNALHTFPEVYPPLRVGSLPRSTSPAPSLGTNLQDSTGILTCLPSTTPVGLILGPDSPSMDEPCGGSLRFSGHWILTNVCVTQADILTSASSTYPSGTASP